jgi:hypothetical protein
MERVENVLNVKDMVDVHSTTYLLVLIVGAMEMLAAYMVLHVGLVTYYQDVNVRYDLTNNHPPKHYI